MHEFTAMFCQVFAIDALRNHVEDKNVEVYSAGDLQPRAMAVGPSRCESVIDGWHAIN